MPRAMPSSKNDEAEGRADAAAFGSLSEACTSARASCNALAGNTRSGGTSGLPRPLTMTVEVWGVQARLGQPLSARGPACVGSRSGGRDEPSWIPPS